MSPKIWIKINIVSVFSEPGQRETEKMRNQALLETRHRHSYRRFSLYHIQKRRHRYMRHRHS